jgi:hypothetical protein
MISEEEITRYGWRKAPSTPVEESTVAGLCKMLRISPEPYLGLSVEEFRRRITDERARADEALAIDSHPRAQAEAPDPHWQPYAARLAKLPPTPGMLAAARRGASLLWERLLGESNRAEDRGDHASEA